MVGRIVRPELVSKTVDAGEDLEPSAGELVDVRFQVLGGGEQFVPLGLLGDPTIRRQVGDSSVVPESPAGDGGPGRSSAATGSVGVGVLTSDHLGLLDVGVSRALLEGQQPNQRRPSSGSGAILHRGYDTISDGRACTLQPQSSQPHLPSPAPGRLAANRRRFAAKRCEAGVVGRGGAGVPPDWPQPHDASWTAVLSASRPGSAQADER